MSSMTSEMTKVYKNKSEKVGNDKGTCNVYWISVKQHRGIHQGYIGVSSLNLEGLEQRYYLEAEEAACEDAERKDRRVLQMIRKYKGKLSFQILASGMTREDALDLEGRLRPKDNLKGKELFNWNMKKGG